MLNKTIKSHTIAFTLLMLVLIFPGCEDGAATAPESVPDENIDYELVWSDEFDEDGVPDPEKWTYETGFVRNYEAQWYQSDNAYVEDGLLVIEGRKETVTNPNYNAKSSEWQYSRKEAYYTSASVTTKGLHSWQYARIEVKARIITEEGLWPAIWTLGEGYEWPIGGEVDIMEYYDHSILANAAWSGQNQWQALWDTNKTPVSSDEWGDEFHVWRMDWTYHSIKIYLDDELRNTINLKYTNNQRGTIANPFRETSQFIILNLALGGTHGGSLSNTSFPSRYEIDYVRVYQEKSEDSN